MTDYFDICGTPIPYANIKNFRLVQKEYIYRPKYLESVYQIKGMFNTSYKTEYVYDRMIPYAAIVDETDRRGVFGNIHAEGFVQGIGKEILGDIRETVGDKFNIKAISGKKYRCVNQAERVFYTYLDEIPAFVVGSNGKPMDIYPTDPVFQNLGTRMSPTIKIVTVLLIVAEQSYAFWGNGIQIADIQAEYERLKIEMTEYNKSINKKGKFIESKKTPLPIEVKVPQLPNVQMPNIPVPKVSLPGIKKKASSTDEQISSIKKQMADGEISEAEFQEQLKKIIEKI